MRWSARCLLAMALLSWGLCHAGRTCDVDKALTLDTLDKSMKLAAQTVDALNASGAQVVILARAGQDLSKYGLRYSHLGFAYKQPDGNGQFVWRVLHKLNDCGTPDSAIYRQGIGDFFLDDLWRYEAAYVIPEPVVQAALIGILRDEPLAIRLHQKSYSLVSYVWGKKYQQSNQWALETMAAAMGGLEGARAATRGSAQEWLKSHQYTPAVLEIDALTRLGARMFRANVAFDDHPDEKRYAGKIETVTVDSVFGWTQQQKLSGAVVRLP